MIDFSSYYPTLTAPYKSWPDKQLITGTHFIYTCMISREVFIPLATEIADFGVLSEDFSNKVAVAGNREKNAVIAKDIARNSLITSVLNLGNSVTKIANGDGQILSSAGMQLRRRPQPLVLGMPGNLVISAGSLAGQITTKVDSVKGARSYVVRYTIDPQTPASTWTSITCTTRQCVIDGLQSGAKYWIIVGAVGGNGQTMWSVAQPSPYVP